VKSDLPYLAHIADSIAAIEEYTRGGRDAFIRERLVQDAVIRNFEIIGEAAGRLSPSTRGSGSAATWTKRLISATRQMPDDAHDGAHEQQ
jgi:uncharacterized protein with HEPN domain